MGRRRDFRRQSSRTASAAAACSYPPWSLFSLLSVFSGMATGLVGLLLIRALMGVAEGAVAPTGVAVAVEASHPKRRGMNNGIFQCSISLWAWPSRPSWRPSCSRSPTGATCFMIVGVPGLIVAVVMWFIVREPAPAPVAQLRRPRLHARSFWSMFKHRNMPLAMVSLLCAMTGVFVLSAMMPSYLVDYLKLQSTHMGFVASAIGVGRLSRPVRRADDFGFHRPADWRR